MTEDPNRIEISLEDLDGPAPPAEPPSPAADPVEPVPASPAAAPPQGAGTALPPLPPRQSPKVVQLPEDLPAPAPKGVVPDQGAVVVAGSSSPATWTGPVECGAVAIVACAVVLAVQAHLESVPLPDTDSRVVVVAFAAVVAIGWGLVRHLQPLAVCAGVGAVAALVADYLGEFLPVDFEDRWVGYLAVGLLALIAVAVGRSAGSGGTGARNDTAEVAVLVGLGLLWKLVSLLVVVGAIGWYFYAQQDTQEVDCIGYQISGDTPPFPDVVTCFLNGHL